MLEGGLNRRRENRTLGGGLAFGGRSADRDTSAILGCLDASRSARLSATSEQFPLLIVGEFGLGGIPTDVGRFSPYRSPGHSERTRRRRPRKQGRTWGRSPARLPSQGTRPWRRGPRAEGRPRHPTPQSAEATSDQTCDGPRSARGARRMMTPAMKPSTPKTRGNGTSALKPNTQRGTRPAADHAAAQVKPIPIAPRMRRSHFRMIVSDARRQICSRPLLSVERQAL